MRDPFIPALGLLGPELAAEDVKEEGQELLLVLAPVLRANECASLCGTIDALNLAHVAAETAGGDDLYDRPVRDCERGRARTLGAGVGTRAIRNLGQAYCYSSGGRPTGATSLGATSAPAVTSHTPHPRKHAPCSPSSST